MALKFVNIKLFLCYNSLPGLSAFRLDSNMDMQKYEVDDLQEDTALFNSFKDLDYEDIDSEEIDEPREISMMSDDLKNTENKEETTCQSTDCQKISDKIEKIKSKQPSLVWKYFVSVSNSTARCTLCNKIFKHCGNTSNMIQHLQRKHLILWSAKVTEKHNTNEANFVQSTDESTSEEPKRIKLCKKIQMTKIKNAFKRANSFMEGEKADKITNSILYMIAVDKMALTTTENKGFKWLMKTIVPLYKLPSRRTITKLIEARYKILKESFTTKIEKAICYSLTCDNWTDNANQSYLGVTIHFLTEEVILKTGCIGVFPLHKNHTAEYLANSLDAIIQEFKIDRSKITAIISDSAANIKLAIEKTIGKQKQLPCFAHILSHIVPDALSNIPNAQEIINKVKKIVTIVRRSIVASDELKSLQLRDGKSEGTALKLIQDVSTRWNSTLYMLNRFLELEQYIYPVISKCDNPPDMLKRDEIQMLKEFVSLMKPIENVIAEVSGESYPTCSMIIPLIHCIKASIYYSKPNTKTGIIFKEKLLSAIESRCKNFENNEIMAIATILDPRFKKLHFEKALAAATAITRIDSLLKRGTPLQNMTNKMNVDIVSKECDSVWGFHDHLVAKHNINPNEELNELRQYLTQPIIEHERNPLQYWKSMKHTFPMLYEQAVKYVSILGTSVPSERIFSQAGDIKTDERSRLTGEHLNMLLFLSSVAFEDWGLQ